MLTIKLHTDQDGLALRLSGHAGAGKWGTDIVCAAASILTYTAAAAAGQLYREGKLERAPYIRLCPGDALVALEDNRAAREAMGVIRTGFELLAVRYPKYVRLETEIFR